MSTQIKKHYINVQGRRVHFRSGGVGPVMLLLHQSPQSSRTMLPLAEKLVSRYCVIAPNGPGFGLSDALPMQAPTIEDIADALHEFTDAVKLPPATIIGVHTGAGQGSAHHLRQLPSIPHRLVCPVECRDQSPVSVRLEDEA